MVTIGLGILYIPLNFHIFPSLLRFKNEQKSMVQHQNITSYNPNQNKSRAYILRLQYPLSKHTHHVSPAIQGYLVPLCEVLCTSQVHHQYNQ